MNAHLLNTLHNENCITTMQRISDDSIDLVLTSPPYDNLRHYDGYTFNFLITSQEITRILKPGGVLVWVVGDETRNGTESGTSFRQALQFMDNGLNLHDTMIYEKNSSTFPAQKASNRYTQIFEYMFVFTKGKPTATLICDKPNKWAGHKDYAGKLRNPVPDYSPRTNIWRYTTSKNSFGHPAPYPLELAKDHIKTWTTPHQTVYDPFMGSGTTAVASIELERNWIGSEISEQYCEIINNRVAQHSKQK